VGGRKGEKESNEFDNAIRARRNKSRNLRTPLDSSRIVHSSNMGGGGKLFRGGRLQLSLEAKKEEGKGRRQNSKRHVHSGLTMGS